MHPQPAPAASDAAACDSFCDVVLEAVNDRFASTAIELVKAAPSVDLSDLLSNYTSLVAFGGANAEK